MHLGARVEVTMKFIIAGRERYKHLVVRGLQPSRARNVHPLNPQVTSRSRDQVVVHNAADPDFLNAAKKSNLFLYLQ